MYYKQISSANQIQAIGETVDNAILSPKYIQITEYEYNKLKRVLTLDTLSEVKMTPINEKGELIYASV